MKIVIGDEKIVDEKSLEVEKIEPKKTTVIINCNVMTGTATINNAL